MRVHRLGASDYQERGDMQRRRVLFQGAGAVAAASLGVWPRAGRSQQLAGLTEGRLVLGQSAAFSGPAEQLGLQYYLGAKLYFDGLNDKGGVNGRTIEIQRLDDAYEPERCLKNTRQLIQEGVFALFGYVGTPTSLAALPLATAEKMPFFAPSTGADALREPFNRYVFHLRASYADETAAIVRQLTSVGLKRIAVFYQDDAYGQSVFAGVNNALKALQLAPVATGTVVRNTTDVDAALKSILAAEPEAIVQISSYKACAAFVRLARRQGYKRNFYNVSFVGTQALLDELGAEARGVAVSQVMPFPYGPSSGIASEYLALLKDKRGIAPNYSGMEGFVAAKTFAEGVKRAGRNLSREGFVDAVSGMQKVNLGGFQLDFGPRQHVGSRFVEMTLLTEDGKVRR
jgi:branched-chain amino acid transport system substrate-binding protein